MSGQLHTVPRSFAVSRARLHQIAFFVLSPARFQAVGRMGLGPTPNGFGTPEYEGRVVRVEGDQIITEQSGNSASQTISTIGDAARFAGIEYETEWFQDFRDPLTPTDPEQPLDIDPAATAFLGDWFRFAWGALAGLKSIAGDGGDPSETQLWPEHFDAATEIGDEAAGQRAGFGASPGDDAHPRPYIYVVPWSSVDDGAGYWNDDAFAGASLDYEILIGSADPLGAAIEFFDEGRRLLAGRAG